MSPEDRKYTKTHEWVKVEGDTAVVGITDHAQKALGDITFVELPSVGKVVKQAQECGVVESVKAASDIYAPVAGKVVEVNNMVSEKPETVNQDAYGAGWMVKFSDFDAEQVAGLLSAEEYDQTAGQH